MAVEHVGSSIQHDGPAWNTTDVDNPQPNVYPVCPTCRSPWVWRRFLSLSTGGYKWLWARDCKHKTDPELLTPDTADGGE